jgi:DNA-binding transcriptional regulator YhcF (GntR family)
MHWFSAAWRSTIGAVAQIPEPQPGPPLDLSVDRESELPLGTQLTWKLQAAIATGALAPGDRLPGVRQLAEEAGVNVNTVRSVYARLEDQGLVASEHGRGTFVADRAPANAELGRLAARAADDARRAGIEPRALAAAMYVGSDAGTGDAPDERARLRAEIAELERQVAYHTRHRVGAAPKPSSSQAGRLPTTDELRAIRNELLADVDRLRRVEGEGQVRATARRELERTEAEVERERAEREAERAAREHAGGASRTTRPGLALTPQFVWEPGSGTFRWRG